jgi:hypothetical protein
MFTTEQGRLLNSACAEALSGVLKTVSGSNPDLHAQILMSNTTIALKYLRYIHHIAIDGYSPIAVSLFRTYYEIVCSTMYLSEHKDELDDFLDFGRRMYYEIGEDQKLKGKLLNQVVPDHKELRERFLAKRNARGGQLLSWRGMTIETLGNSVGMEKYMDAQIVRSHYSRASKLVHGDSLAILLAYNPDEGGMQPLPFAEPMSTFRVDALAVTCGLFIVLIASVGVGLNIVFKELDRLNAVWREIVIEATGKDPRP